jgi:hypothetical protein
LPPNSRTDPARLHQPERPQTFVQLIHGHYTSRLRGQRSAVLLERATDDRLAVLFDGGFL